jgi:hypothetical protein
LACILHPSIRKTITFSIRATPAQLQQHAALSFSWANRGVVPELEDTRRQTEIWKSSSSSEVEKVKLENDLLKKQMQV